MKRSRAWQLGGCTVAVLAALFAFSGDAWGVDCAIADPAFTLPQGLNSIGIKYGGQWGGPTQVTNAANKWEDACSGEGITYPDLRPTHTGDLTFWTAFKGGNAPAGTDGCSDVILTTVGGELTGATIRIWQKRPNGSNCTASVANRIAHEIGHALGFNDGGAPCLGTVMGPAASAMNVAQEFCGMLRYRWKTWRDLNPECDQECICEIDPYGPGCYSPIVVDMDGYGFQFCGPEDGVWFDVNADDAAEHITWIAEESYDAFLCRDLNGNGMIDSGAELFGNHTELLDGSVAAHGYQALAELDSGEAGGNDDGVVDTLDAGYGSLCVWFDPNHDGVSDQGEVMGLAEAGIEILETAFRTSRRRDRYGNLLRYHGKAWVLTADGTLRRARTVDVFFQPASP